MTFSNKLGEKNLEYIKILWIYIREILSTIYVLLGIIPVLGPFLQLASLILAGMIIYFNCPYLLRSFLVFAIRCSIRIVVWLTPGADEVFYELRGWMVSLIQDWVTLAAPASFDMMAYPAKLWDWTI